MSTEEDQKLSREHFQRAYARQMKGELDQAVEGNAFLNTLSTISSIDMWVKPLTFLGMASLLSGIGLALATIVRVLRWQSSRLWDLLTS